MKKKVVVVEDDESIRDILQIILEREGYSTINCRDGNDIFNGTVEVPDLYMIDRQLSGADGLEVCKFLRQQHTTNSVPIIILSATPGIENIQSLQAPMYLSKNRFRKSILLK